MASRQRLAQASRSVADVDAVIQVSAFIQGFIVKERRERLLFEFHKYRGQFLGRFNHDALKYLEPRYVTQLPKAISDAQCVGEVLRSKGAPSTCYALSTNSAIDERVLPLAEALEGAVQWGMPSLLFCIPGELAYLEAEQSVGPPDRFILARAYAPGK